MRNFEAGTVSIFPYHGIPPVSSDKKHGRDARDTKMRHSSLVIRHSSFRFALLFLALALAGCCTQPPPVVNHSSDPMAKVVSDINANNLKIPTLWAHHYFEADVVDEKKQSHHVSGDGVLLYISPMNMRLKANAVVGTIFEIGSNKTSYWLKLGPEAGDTFWWGTYADFARMNPDDARIPIRPDMILDVLGVATINSNFNALPIPIMRYDPAADAYIFIWIGRLPDRWVALREVWYDRQTKRPRQVLLYDMNGRVALKAKLDQYRQVQIDKTPREQWPWIPGNYDLVFPESNSRLRFTLDDAALAHPQDGVVVPVQRSFVMPDPQTVDAGRVIQIK